MKITRAAAPAALLLGQTSSTFITHQPTQSKNQPTNKSHKLTHHKLLHTTAHHQFKKSMPLWARQSFDEDYFNGYLGEDKSSEARQALLYLTLDDMTSLQKCLENGLNPDIKFFLGNTILHIIAVKGDSTSLDEKKYLNILDQLVKSGADLHAKNDAGHEVMDFLVTIKSGVFVEKLKHAQNVKIKPPIKRTSLDTQLATFSLQKQPTNIAKQLIPELIKMGANPEYVTINGKTISENIKQNWPPASAQAFTDMVIAAKFKSAANGQDKSLDKNLFDTPWTNACLAFYEESKSN